MPAQTATPAQRRAMFLVSEALRRGTLHRASRCSACGKAKKLHAHHADYAKPLDVQWLCAACHMAEHARLGWGLPWSKRKAA